MSTSSDLFLENVDITQARFSDHLAINSNLISVEGKWESGDPFGSFRKP
jgi:hypothetical protein